MVVVVGPARFSTGAKGGDLVHSRNKGTELDGTELNKKLT